MSLSSLKSLSYSAGEYILFTYELTFIIKLKPYKFPKPRLPYGY
jgi:hypothetical protein